MPSAWPAEDDASVRPGMRLYFFDGDVGSQCTAGFMFRSSDNATLYLATTAHCIHGGIELSVGATVYNNRGSTLGQVVYDGWATNPNGAENDLILIALDNVRGVRDKAHPAVLALSGPTGAADVGQLPPGSGVKAVGYSGSRDSWQTMTGNLIASPPAVPGDITGSSGRSYADMQPHPIEGDSGGPLMATDGRALGLLHGGIPISRGFGNVEIDIYTPLAPQMPRIRASGGDLANIELVTWP